MGALQTLECLDPRGIEKLKLLLGYHIYLFLDLIVIHLLSCTSFGLFFAVPYPLLPLQQGTQFTREVYHLFRCLSWIMPELTHDYSTVTVILRYDGLCRQPSR
jgi:hypothetical protein